MKSHQMRAVLPMLLAATAGMEPLGRGAPFGNTLPRPFVGGWKGARYPNGFNREQEKARRRRQVERGILKADG